MNLVDGYDSGSEPEQPTRGILVAPVMTINPNPDVSTDAIEAKALMDQQRKIDHYSRTEKEKSHLSGKVEQWHMNNFSFDEQYHNFTTYGFAMDPNDQVNKLIVTSFAKEDKGAFNPKKDIKLVDPNDPEFAARSVFGLQTKEENEKKKEMAKKRKKFGDASTGNFQGPWASYEGRNIARYSLVIGIIGEEQINIDQNLELDEERKQILNAIEEKRKKKLEEKKEEQAQAVNIFLCHNPQFF